MIFWIILLITIAFFIWGFFSDWDFCPLLGSVLGGATSLVLAIVIIVNHLGVNGYVELYAELNKTRYDILVYQYENNFYDNDNDVGKYELVQDIREWNEDLSKYKELQDDLWVGIFYPNIYDQFEFIEIN